MNLPNTLTLIRIVLSIPFFVFALREDWFVAFWLFAIGASTDMIDGALARLLKRKTRLGAFLDPAADKLLMLFGFISLCRSGALPLWLVALVVARDVMISGGVIFFCCRKKELTIRPTLTSKGTTAFQIATLGYALLAVTFGIDLPGDPWLIGATAFLTAISGYQYFWIGLKILKVPV